MAPTIRIDDEVYAWLQGQARAFEDTPNSVLRKLAKLDDPGESSRSARVVSGRVERGVKTPQSAYREPLLKVLAKHGGQAARTVVLKELEKMLAKQLTQHDRGQIKSGAIRWERSAEWEVRVMREKGLLKPVKDAPPGHWTLTEAGKAAAMAA
jgi:hypothetical protein